MSYTYLKRVIQSTSASYLPALLVAVIHECVKRGTFKKSGIEEVVAKAIANAKSVAK